MLDARLFILRHAYVGGAFLPGHCIFSTCWLSRENPDRQIEAWLQLWLSYVWLFVFVQAFDAPWSIVLIPSNSSLFSSDDAWIKPLID